MILVKLPTLEASEADLMITWKNNQGRITIKLLKRENNGAGEISLAK